MLWLEQISSRLQFPKNEIVQEGARIVMVSI
jgi:hypothetical protein